MWSLFLTILIYIGSTNATNLYFVNNSNVADPKVFDYILSFDTSAKTIKGYPTSIPSADIIVSGAIVCNYTNNSSMYYAVWVAALDGPGILAFDIQSGQMTNYATLKGYNYHVFQCTDTKNTLLGVSNDFSSPPKYYLDELTISGTRITRKQIGEYPQKGIFDDGYDTIFSFNPSANELWASWSNSDKNPDSGTLDIIDTNTGKIKSSYSFPRKFGEPYFTIPQTLKGNTFKGASLNPSNGGVTWMSLTFDGDSLDVSDSTSANYLYSESQPQPICGTTSYAVSAAKQRNIIAYDIQTGKEIATYNMELYGNIVVGGIACF